ncbi:accessory Sec system protein Asp2 [Staphylococcus rostri]|uniref:accessory Sec system protein Asp2 n=1 Tax=Staphylococcus rostri TaxID=522262 RepID=UPI0028527276|nr:accessory Sec system protein Asp2 [Staphylococcus rostri]
MARNFKVLQVSGQDMTSAFQDKSGTEWHYVSADAVLREDDSVREVLIDKGPFEFIYVEMPYSEVLMTFLAAFSEPYTTYIDQAYWDDDYAQHPMTHRYLIRPFIYQSMEERSEKLQAVTFPGQYGDKISPKFCMLQRPFEGISHYDGNNAFVVSGDFGDTMTPLLTWQRYQHYDKDKVIQVWPEYTLTGDVDVEFVFRLVPMHATDTVDEVFVKSHAELTTPLEISRRPYEAHIIINMRAKGNGTIRMGAVHKRWSRLDMGQFILGGERYVDADRSEFIHYFHPGDMKPPLNVYFSGYHSAQGFEGYFMMKRMKAPFILIADPRVEGGAFYLGSETYERAIKKVIQDGLDRLGFQPEELILSGMSMGSFGALYYGAQLNPAAIIAGKPLINVGTVAENMPRVRPEDFGTSLDILRKNEGSLTPEAITHLNDKFWQQFNQADFTNTTFAIAYMAHDDYDKHAFDMLLPILSRQQARIMQRSIPGRHNDDTPTIASWFKNFYHMILESQFGREQ